jgi:hypothetical protein
MERAEAELDRFISRRVREAGDAQRAQRVEEEWAESVRLHYSRRRESLREAWRAYHLEQAARLEATAAELAAGHRARAEALLSGGERGGASEGVAMP